MECYYSQVQLVPYGTQDNVEKALNVGLILYVPGRVYVESSSKTLMREQAHFLDMDVDAVIKAYSEIETAWAHIPEHLSGAYLQERYRAPTLKPLLDGGSYYIHLTEFISATVESNVDDTYRELWSKLIGDL